MEKLVKDIYAKDIEILRTILDKEGQVCLCGLDKKALEILVKAISLSYKARGFFINYNQTEIIKIQSKTLCLIDVGTCTSLSQNKVLYYYLEQTARPSPETKVLMFSNDCSSMDGLERRVKSRFTDNIHILRTPSLDEYHLLYEKINSSSEYSEEVKHEIKRQFKIFPSLEKLTQIFLRDRYEIKKYSDKEMLSKLNNIHLSLLILSCREKLEYKNVVREFKKFTVKVKELRNVQDEEILFYFYDLLDFGLVSEKGVFLYSEIELKDFVMGNSPTYLRGLFKLLK